MRKAASKNLLDQLVEVVADLGRQSPAPVVSKEAFAALAAPAPKGTSRPARAAAPPPRIATPARAPAPEHTAAPAAKVAGPAPALFASDGGLAEKLAGVDLAELERLAAACTRCPLHASRTHSVFSDGPGNARLMFIGEGPGRDEDLQGKPFVGRAGQLLTKMIEAMQFRRDEVYIANIVKCRPPENRVPTEEEAAACVPYLRRQIELIRPQVIVLLGATAVRYLLNTSGGITRLRGTWLEYAGVKVMPTFHPAYLLRNPPAKKEAWADLQQVMRVFGKDPRQKTG